MTTSLTTPGVFIQEVNAFPNSVVPVATAVPAFVGYTTRASLQGKDLHGQPVRISTWQEFQRIFGAVPQSSGGNGIEETVPWTGPLPAYHLVPTGSQTGDITFGGTNYALRPDPGTLYQLDLSLRLFFNNGGGACYVVSAGPIRPGTGTPLNPGQPAINPNVQLAELKAALAALQSEPEVTLIVVPEATLLPFTDYELLMQEVLNQCGTLGSRMGILDLYGAQQPDPTRYVHDLIEPFRAAVGPQHLKYGAAYFPFLRTDLLPESAIPCDRFGGAAALARLLPEAAQEPVKSLLASLQQPPLPNQPTHSQLENALAQSSPTYAQLRRLAAERTNILPPSGAIAGVYTQVDAQRGVWGAPANLSPTSVVGTTLPLTDEMQAGLNVDAVTGKSINAIRTFPSLGVVIWGARTLDGNSDEWRYIPVVRTVIMIEQSVKAALQSYVFQANNATTWTTVRAMLTSFLTNLWNQGALAGSTPADAFSVAVGLGTTVTAQDILNGAMIVSVNVALTHPAEFIVLTFSQQMATS